MPLMAKWSRDSPLAADHVAAGSFENAMQVMRRQLGIMDFVPLKPLFLAIASASHAVAPGVPSAAALLAPLTRSGQMPRLCLTLSSLVDQLKPAYTLVTAGKFQEASDAFLNLARAATLTVVDSRQQVGELKELMSICQEYLTALRLELTNKLTTEPKRKMELAAYFTHCNLSPPHAILALRSAMTTAFKLQLMKSAGAFARRLLELNPKPEFATKARQVIQRADQNPSEAFEYAYDERNPFAICNADLMPIYRGSAQLARCTLCKAPYGMAYKGTKCLTCKLGTVGGDAAGIDEASVLSRGGSLD